MEKTKSFAEMSESDKTVGISYGILPEDAPRHSIWRPVGSLTSTIMETDFQGKTWFLTIHNDDLGYTVAAFLQEHGAPVFSSAQEHSAYVNELERQLRMGLTPATARDEALRIVGVCINNETTPQG